MRATDERRQWSGEGEQWFVCVVTGSQEDFFDVVEGDSESLLVRAKEKLPLRVV